MKSIYLLLSFSILVFALGLSQKGAITAFDERLYFKIAESMYEHHERIVPPPTAEILPGHQFNTAGIPEAQTSAKFPAFYKEPLLYWCLMVAFHFFGSSPLVARGVIVLFSMATILTTYLLGKELFEEKTGILAALFLLSSLGFYQLGRSILLDIPLTFFIAFGVLCFCKERYTLGFIALGLSSLLKGPVGPLLGMLIVFGYLLFFKKLHKIYSWQFLVGYLIVIVLIASYPMAVAYRGYGDLWLKHFIMTENIGKFFLQRKSGWIMVTSFLSYLFPWFLIFMGGLVSLKRAPLKPSAAFVLWGFLIPFLFFLFPSEKLDRFLLPLLPFATLFLAYMIREANPTFAIRLSATATAILLFLIGAVTFAILPLLHTPMAWIVASIILATTWTTSIALLRANFFVAAVGAALAFSLSPFVLSLPSAPMEKEVKRSLSQRPSFGIESTIDEVFTLTGLNTIEIHTLPEIGDALSKGYFIISEHELKDYPLSTLPPMQQAFFWYRWNPALRIPNLWKAFITRSPELLLEKVMVFTKG